MNKNLLKEFRSRQQVKDEQINYLLADVEKNLEEYKQVVEIKEKQISDAKKILVSAKQNYNNVILENITAKSYIDNLKKQHLQKQQEAHFLRNQKKIIPRKYKKVKYQEETESEPELEKEEEEGQIESESESSERKSKIKKAQVKKKRQAKNNIFDYINNAKRNKR